MSRRRLAIALTALACALVTADDAAAQGLSASGQSRTAASAAADRGFKASCIPVVAIACGLAGDAIGVVGDVATDVIGAGAGVIGNGVLDGISSWVGQGAAWLIERIGQQVERSTRPELGATWFTEQYRGMLTLALLLALAFLLAALTHAALRQDLAAALRAAFVALPTAVIACFAAVTLVELLLAATDDATRLLTQQTGDDSRAFFDELATAVVPSGGALPGFLALLGGVLAALLCIVVWLELILREAAVYLAVGFLPLSLAAMVWHRSAHLARRLVEGLVAVIVAKLAIAVAVAFAASALANGGGAGGITTMLAGCAVLFLAALSPWVLLRLIPIGGDAQLHRGSVKQAVGTAPGASTAAMVVRTGMYSSFASAPAAPAMAAAAAPPSRAWTPTPPTGAGMRLETSQPEKPTGARDER
jgi:hypothetical protein